MNNILKELFFRPRWYAIILNPYYIARRKLYKAICNFSQTLTNKKILDLGCGCKPYESLFVGSEYIGIDIYGGGHSDQSKANDLFFDGKKIPFDDNTFDAVICTQVLEHVEDPEKLIKEADRVLKAGGIFFVTCPFVWQEHEVPYDFRRYSQFGLKKILSENNFVVKSINGTTGIFETVGQLVSSFIFEMVGKKKVIRLSAAILICFPFQLFSIMLDFIFRHKGMSLDYVVISKKYEA